MQDRFKLRYFFEKEKKIYDVVFIDFSLPCASLYVSDEDLLHISKRDFKFENLIQCTGLKDKNGKLIYEGDIVKTRDGVLNKVFWENEYAQFLSQEIGGFEICSDFMDYEDIEVIGNIYQHPELLEDK